MKPSRAPTDQKKARTAKAKPRTRSKDTGLKDRPLVGEVPTSRRGLAPPDAEILARWSTPGLRRNCLDRNGKKAHLRSGFGVVGADAAKLLDEIFRD